MRPEMDTVRPGAPGLPVKIKFWALGCVCEPIHVFASVASRAVDTKAEPACHSGHSVRRISDLPVAHDRARHPRRPHSDWHPTMVMIYGLAVWAGLEALRSLLSYIVPYTAIAV